MQHIFLLGKEGFNYFNSPIYKIITDMISNSKNQFYMSNLSLKKRLTQNTFNNVKCFNISLPKLGMSTYFLYDYISLKKTLSYIRKHKLNNSTIILFSTRIGVMLPFFDYYLKKYNVNLIFYYDTQDSVKNNYATFLPFLFNTSEYISMKYSDEILFYNESSEKYLLDTYKMFDLKLSRVSYSHEFIEKEFENFLFSYGLKHNDYYLFVDKCTISSNILFVVNEFKKTTTKKKLLVLSEKNKSLHKKLIFNCNVLQDKRIIYLNYKRFMHLIPSITQHCYGYIHSNVRGINPYFLAFPFKDDILNIAFDNKFNRQVKLDNVVYFNYDNFVSTINDPKISL